jgi:hypothetical protein
MIDADEGLNLAVAEFWPSAIRNPKHKERLRERSRALRRAITESVEQYRDELGAELPYPAEHIATMLFAIGDGLATQRSLDPDSMPSGLFATAIATLWTGLLGADHWKAPPNPSRSATAGSTSSPRQG